MRKEYRKEGRNQTNNYVASQHKHHLQLSLNTKGIICRLILKLIHLGTSSCIVPGTSSSPCGSVVTPSAARAWDGSYATFTSWRSTLTQTPMCTLLCVSRTFSNKLILYLTAKTRENCYSLPISAFIFICIFLPFQSCIFIIPCVFFCHFLTL